MNSSILRAGNSCCCSCLVIYEMRTLGHFSFNDKPQEDDNILTSFRKLSEPGAKPITLNVLLIALNGQPRHPSCQLWTNTGIQPGSPVNLQCRAEKLTIANCSVAEDMNTKDAELVKNLTL